MAEKHAVDQRRRDTRQRTRVRTGVVLGLVVLAGGALARWVGAPSTARDSAQLGSASGSARAAEGRAGSGTGSDDRRDVASTPTLGPWTFDPPPASQSPSSGQLTVAQLSDTVAEHQAALKRRCWQPARDARPSDAPRAVRVHVTLTIAKNGAPTEVTTSGDPRGYPGLASCLARAARAWRFPAASATTSVTVPFVFSVD